ncbi:MAG: hypothetical protein CR994_05680 [Maribacter sp.]|nr:MAG: hypothetical protein CR994_05680 [Maribacter sp.]
MSGSYVDPALSALDIVKEMKSKGIETKGYILGLPKLFSGLSQDVPKGRKRTIGLLFQFKQFYISLGVGKGVSPKVH